MPGPSSGFFGQGAIPGTKDPQSSYPGFFGRYRFGKVQQSTSAGVYDARMGTMPASLSMYKDGGGGIAELYAAYLKIGREKEIMFAALRDVENESLVQTILEIMRDDVLSPDGPSNEIFSIGSNNSKYDAILKGMESRVDLDALVGDIIYDLLLFGEYPLKVFADLKSDGRGEISSLEDLNEPEGILPVFKSRKVFKYLVSQGKRYRGQFSRGAPEPLSPNDFVMFLRHPKTLRAVRSEYHPYLSGGVIKVGRSVFPLQALEKIKTLALLERIMPFARILQLDRNSIIGVRMGQTTMMHQAMKAVREYERFLNARSSSVDPLDIMSLIKNIGKYKVIPLMGDKGDIQDMTPPAPEIGDMTDINDMRTSIISSVGLPPSYVSGDNNAASNESLKAYVRYLRKLESVQRCLVEGLMHLSLVELNIQGHTGAMASDVKISFSNLVSISNIERLEFLDILVTLLQNYTTFIDTLSQQEGVGEYIDKVAMLQFLHSKLRNFRGAEAPLKIEGPGGTAYEPEQPVADSLDDIVARLPKEMLNEAQYVSGKALVEIGVARKNRR
jgi:hypothetical protein